MTDVIRILGMRVPVHVGAPADERARAQAVEIDLELQTDCTDAAASDNIADAVDYAHVYDACKKALSGRSFALLESLAAACLAAVLVDPRIRSATLRVRKPGILEGATPEIELTRANPGKAALGQAAKGA
ncbi:MAG TPA: dihydroneopterin aldolase [Candidatus Binatus sp.]|nr:dihydroneopterin aldolase [Candidatus Binatus sp.]